MSSPRIALIRQKYNPAGGAERFVSRAIQALTGEGARISLITRKWEPIAGMEPIEVNPFYLGNVWRDWGFARAACAAQHGRQFDLVQSHERLSCCDIYRAGDGVHREWLAQRRRVLSLPARVGLALNPYHQYARSAEARMFASPRLRAVICNSRMVRDEIVAWFGTDPAKLHIIYNGIDCEQFHPRLRDQHRQALRASLGIADHEMVFVYVGSGFERKGVGAALQALARLPAPTRLLIVGSDKKSGRYQALARQLGLGSRALFVGARKDVKPYYGAADALLLPTLMLAFCRFSYQPTFLPLHH